MAITLVSQNFSFPPGQVIPLCDVNDSAIVFQVNNLSANQWLTAGWIELYTDIPGINPTVSIGRHRAIYNKALYVPKPVFSLYSVFYQPESWISEVNIFVWAL